MSSQGTLIQRWTKCCTVTAAVLLITAHIAAFLLAAFLCPQLFKARSYEGVHCQLRGDEDSFDLALSGCAEHNTEDEKERESVCLTRGTGDIVRLRDIRMSFKFPLEEDGETLSSWNWRLVGSLALSVRILDKNFSLPASSEELQLSASLDYAPVRLLRAMKEDCSVPSSPWHSKARLLGEQRTLTCTKYSDDNQNYRCSLHPLFELFVLSNSSYVLQVRLDRSDLLAANVTVSSQLTVVRETETFHRINFYTKCLFTPLLLACLVWFMVRLCVNDLYVTIHDRLLITAGLAQVVNNIPTEVAVANYPNTFLTLLEPLSHVVLLTSLLLFWTVFTLDKLADNEPWERNTRYYWRPLLVILFSAALSLLGVLFMRFPPLNNPFLSHWLTGPTTYLSLAFTFTIAVIVASFQTYLSVLVFRVVCDVSVRYPGCTRGAWRLKLILVYCLGSSVVVCLGAVLRLAVSLCLHWNTEVHTQPLPFSVSLASLFYIGELAATNIHLISLLLLLSRSSGSQSGDGGWYTPVSPVMYSPTTTREEQLHLWDLSAHQSPLHKLHSDNQ